MTVETRPVVAHATREDFIFALHALEGICSALEWIEREHIRDVDEADIVSVRASLIIAGRRIAAETIDRI